MSQQQAPTTEPSHTRPESTGQLRRGLVWMAFLAAVALTVSLCWFRIANLDLGYHLAYGNHFLATGEIVGFAPDPFLRDETAVPFVNLNWGSQVVLALVDRLGGVQGLFALRLLLVGLALAAGASMVRRHSRSIFAVAICIVLMVMVAYERFSMRPELFSYALLAWMLWRLDGGLARKRDIAVLFALQLLLVNLHSYFLLGLALTLAFVVGSALAWKLPARDRASAVEKRSMRRYSAALMLQLVACFVHPWHVHAFVLPFKTLAYLSQTDAMGKAGDTTGSSWAAISEFQSPFSFLGEPINAVTIYAYLTLLLVAVVALAGMWLRRRWSWALVMIGIALVSFQMRRNIAPFGLLIAPVAVLGWWQWVGNWKAATQLRGANVGAILTIAFCAGIVFLIVSGRLYFYERRTTRQWGTGYHDLTFSAAAVDWLAAQEGVKPDLYVDYFASSNALIGLPPRFKLFVDTNTFAYDEATLRATQDLEQGRLDHNAFFDRYGIHTVLLRAGSNTQLLIRQMMKDETTWALAYVDRAHVIFLRRGLQAHAEILLRDKINSLDEGWAATQIAATDGPMYERALTLTTIANVPLALGFDEAAVPLLVASLELVPDHAEAWRYLGVAYGNLGNAAARKGEYAATKTHWQQAIDAFERAVSLDGNDKDAATYLDNTRRMLQQLPRR